MCYGITRDLKDRNHTHNPGLRSAGQPLHVCAKGHAKGSNLELANTSHDLFKPIVFSHVRFDRATIPTDCGMIVDSEISGHLR